MIHRLSCRAWLTGVNPELGDRVPLRLLRENDIDAVAPAILNAARSFLAGGALDPGTL